MKPRICFLDAHTVDLGDLSIAKLEKQGDYREFFKGSRKEILKKSAQAEILISNKFYLGDSDFDRLPKVRLICIAATGTNNVDPSAARKRGIAVCNVAGYSTPTVVEHALMFLLALGHRLLPHHRAATDGSWSRGRDFAYLKFPFGDLEGKTLGIVGYGTIGKKVARAARDLGMKILIAKMPGRKYSGSPARRSLQEVLRKSDFVSLHCPLTETTRSLFDAARVKSMKPGACLLNLARGPIVVETAVAAALKAGKLKGYAADVMEQEPPSAENPLLDSKLRDKVLLTPHVAWASRESRQRLVDEIAENIAAWKRGRMRNRVV